ncbi:MAG: DUF4240 domain-containing protein, partial [Chloroflexota bacterium]
MMNPNDLIALREDIKSEGLVRGRIGRILRLTAPDHAEVEFVNDSGHTVAKIELASAQFSLLRDKQTIDHIKFWKLVEETKADSLGDSERQVEILIDRVSRMSIADIFAFRNIFWELKDKAYRRDLWAAAFIIGNGCSDDGFTDFRAWLIAQGESVYVDALHDPESLVDVIPVIDDIFGKRGNPFLEEMNYIADFAYEKKTGEEMPTFFGIYSPSELTG